VRCRYSLKATTDRLLMWLGPMRVLPLGVQPMRLRKYSECEMKND
jgi:hypothetical protein